MKILRSDFLRALAWAVLAAVLGTTIWAALIATVAPLVAGEGVRQIIGWWSTRAVAAFYFGGFVAALAIVPQTLLFTAWFTATTRLPQLRRRVGGLAISSLVLALPLVIVVFACFAAPSAGLGPFWSEALRALPWVWASAWGGILCARRLLESRRGAREPVAA